MTTYHYEVYTKHPQTNETGWDIEVGWVQAESIQLAKKKIKQSIKYFDRFIQLYPANMNPTDKITIK